MITATERLDQVINNLQIDRNPLSGLEPLQEQNEAAEEAELIMAACRLSAMRPGSGQLDASFMSHLRRRVLEAASSTR